MPLKAVPTRRPRVERDDDFHLEDETAHLWAISYADFLMVLLSFFVIFFSLSDGQKESVINQIIHASAKDEGEKGALNLFRDLSGLKEKDGAGIGAGPGGESYGSRLFTGDGSTDQFTESSEKTLVAEVKKVAIDLPELNVIKDPEGNGVMFLMPDNIFPLNEVYMSQEHEEMLTRLLSRLKRFIGDVELIFIGHTDNKRFQITTPQVISNNFDLSSLRASKALNYAIELGWPPARVFTKGASEYNRNSRTLSIVVKPRGGGLR